MQKLETILSIELKRLLQTILWFIRRNERDVVNCYNFLTPFFLRATGNNMLNFGYWTDYTKNPIEAQNELCKLVGKLICTWQKIWQILAVDSQNQRYCGNQFILP